MWTGSRSESSSPQPASGRWAPTTCSHGSTSGSLFLATRARDVPDRQRTLRATIEWSVDLLEPDERATFLRLGVFPGSFAAEAAAAVAGASLDDLEALIERSLVRRWESGRFGMLETIRELAAELLERVR